MDEANGTDTPELSVDPVDTDGTDTTQEVIGTDVPNPEVDTEDNIGLEKDEHVED